MATATSAATGRVIQITGPVVDIEFPAGKLPGIYNAVEIQRKDQDPLTCEVQQHLGNNWVRAVAMTTTDGLARGVEVVDTGAPITVPVGESTLGRVFDVLGHAIEADRSSTTIRVRVLPHDEAAPHIAAVALGAEPSREALAETPAREAEMSSEEWRIEVMGQAHWEF